MNAEGQYDKLRRSGNKQRLNIAMSRADKKSEIFTPAWYSVVVREYAKLNDR